MSVEHFLDTNVLVYTFDDSDPAKQRTARGLVEKALAERTGVVSFQVVQEFLNLALQKFASPLSPVEAEAYLSRVLEPLCGVFSTIDVYRRALSIQERWRFHFFDSLIVAAALEAGCSVLYSEDLQHGQVIETLTVVNPFLAETVAGPSGSRPSPGPPTAPHSPTRRRPVPRR